MKLPMLEEGFNTFMSYFIKLKMTINTSSNAINNKFSFVKIWILWLIEIMINVGPKFFVYLGDDLSFWWAPICKQRFFHLGLLLISVLEGEYHILNHLLPDTSLVGLRKGIDYFIKIYFQHTFSCCAIDDGSAWY